MRMPLYLPLPSKLILPSYSNGNRYGARTSCTAMTARRGLALRRQGAGKRVLARWQ